MDESVLKGR